VFLWLYKIFEGGVAGVLFSCQEKGLGSQVGIKMYTYGVLRLGAGRGDLHRYMRPGLCNNIAVSKEPWNLGSIERGFGLQWGLLHLWPTHPCCNHYQWCYCTSTSKKIIEIFDFVVSWLIRHEKSSVSLLCTYVAQLVHCLDCRRWCTISVYILPRQEERGLWTKSLFDLSKTDQVFGNVKG
jgi:hypothetical protein